MNVADALSDVCRHFCIDGLHDDACVALHAVETDAPVMHVKRDHWDHAISVANRFARRDGVRYRIRWSPRRGAWALTRVFPLGEVSNDGE